MKLTLVIVDTFGESELMASGVNWVATRVLDAETGEIKWALATYA